MPTNSRVRVDKLKNRIYMVLEGFHDIDEALRINALYQSAVQGCKPKFTVLNDVSNYRPGGQEVQDIHEANIKMVEKAGVAKVARVVGDSPLGGMQITRIARKTSSYPSQSFSTVSEAEAWLDQ